MPRDPHKARERSRRYRAKKHAEKYGEGAGDQRGRHGNHAKGSDNGRWGGERLTTSQGYVAVRVPVDHPHAWGPPGLKEFKYAYEHVVVVCEKIGRYLRSEETVHHINGDRADNRPENLELLMKSEHARVHAEASVRDELGRFVPDKPRVDSRGSDPEAFNAE